MVDRIHCATFAWAAPTRIKESVQAALDTERGGVASTAPVFA